MFSSSSLVVSKFESWITTYQSRTFSYMINCNRNTSPGSVDCSLYTRQIALKVDITMKCTSLLTLLWISAVCRFWQRLSSLLADKTSSFKKTFYEAAVRSTVTTIHTSYVFTGSYTENSSCYQLFDLRQLKNFMGAQPIVDYVAADYCCSYVTKMTAMNFPDDIPSIHIDIFK